MTVGRPEPVLVRLAVLLPPAPPVGARVVVGRAVVVSASSVAVLSSSSVAVGRALRLVVVVGRGAEVVRPKSAGRSTPFSCAHV